MSGVGFTNRLYPAWSLGCCSPSLKRLNWKEPQDWLEVIEWEWLLDHGGADECEAEADEEVEEGACEAPGDGHDAEAELGDLGVDEEVGGGVAEGQEGHADVREAHAGEDLD